MRRTRPGARCVSSLRDRARRAEEEQAHRSPRRGGPSATKIAREMHDVLAHRLSLLAAYAGALEFRPDAPPDELARASGVIRLGAHQALEELREVIGVLRDEPGEDEPDRPQPTLADLDRLLAESPRRRHPGHPDDRLADAGYGSGRAGPDRLPRGAGGADQRPQARPGQPVTVLLAARPGGGCCWSSPTRCPSGAAQRLPGSGSGLVGLRERVQLAGGRLDAKSGHGRFRLWAVLPWPA